LFLGNVIPLYNFAAAMKKIAAILLFIFTLVQAGPAVAALFSDSTTVFIVDEEKNNEKIEDAKKEKKESPYIGYRSLGLSHQISTALHVAEKIQAAPCLEMLTPPPNFC
jgi:hypothetical protein